MAHVVLSNMSKNGSNGALSTIRTVSGSGAVASSMLANTPRARGDNSMWNFMTENTTSSAVIGIPSWKRTPSCRRKV